MESPATVIGAVASAPPAVARMVVRPAATAVRSPDASTGASPGSSLDHVMGRPNTRSPAAFRSGADNGTAAPGGTVAALGTMAMDATAPPRTAAHVPEAVPQVAAPLATGSECVLSSGPSGVRHVPTW